MALTIILAEELIDAGLRNLVNDITKIYTLYCNKNMIINDIADEIREIDVTTESMTLDKIPKPMITNINRCCQYFASLIEDRFKYSNLEDLKSSELDLACYNFLPILFEGEPIIRFNTGLLLDLLEKTQSKKINKIVRMRWKAIENYFKGDLDECYKYLIKAEKRAKEQGVANWIYQDILIDERNIKAKIDESKNTWSCSDAQEKIESNKEELYYPIIDRLNSSLNDEYMKGFYEDLVTSPSTVRYGSNLEKCIKLIASTYVLAIYNGSLSHLVMMIDRVRTMFFYLSTKYTDWSYKKNLYKYAVYKGKIKEINEIENKYPEVLNKIDYEVALEVMRFSEISPIKHEDFNHRLIALGTVGYYLDDKKFEFYKSELLKEIFEWIDNDNRVIQNGYSIFGFLTRLQHRLTHEETACICLACLNKSMYRFMDNIFKVIANININKLSIR